MRQTILTTGLLAWVILACGLSGRLYAVSRTAAVSGYWTNAATWPVTGIPANNDDVTINSGVVVTADVSTAALNSMAVGGTLVFSGWNTAITSTTVTISDTVTHPAQNATTTNGAGQWIPDNRIWIVCSNLTVSSGGKIDVNGKGYQGPTPSGTALAGRGPGGGPVSDWAGGGGYGSKGGRAWNTTPGGASYGSASAPTDPGSSGGSAYNYSAGAKTGNGGGAVRIDASGRVTIDGLISANGEDGPSSSYTSSGSSGGGIYITCRSFTGLGIIRSTGGAGPIYSGLGPTGGGSGGRVAVVYDVAEQSNAPTPSVSFNVGGGVSGPSLWFEYAGAPYGEPGTLYLTDLRFFPTNVIASSFSLLSPNATNWAVNTLTVSSSWVRFSAGFAVTVTSSLTVIGSGAIVELPAPVWLTCGGSLILTNGGRLYLSSGPTNGTAPDYGGLLTVGGTLSISTGSAVYATCDPTNGGAIKMTVGALALRNGGTINADGRGFRDWVAGNKGRGPGGGLASDVGSGAGYGGAGSGNQRGNAGGVTYGSSNSPIDAGSAGGNGAAYTGGGSGGGVVRLTVLDRATVDGTISANGWKPIEQSPINGYACGGGSGGSIWIHTPRFFGSGWLKADGGEAGSYVVPPRGPGGGGGGRIAVWRTIGTPCSTSVTGGVGFAQAGDGTVVWGDVPAVGTVFVIH